MGKTKLAAVGAGVVLAGAIGVGFGLAAGGSTTNQINACVNHDGSVRVVTISGASQFSPASRERVVSAPGPGAERAVMFEHCVGADSLAEDAGGLLDNAGERDCVYDPPQSLPTRMFESESERRQCFSATGRHRQGEQPRRAVPSASASLQNFGSETVYRRRGGLAHFLRQMRVELWP